MDLFLSTPSARRATLLTNTLPDNTGYFYPRPPRGGRLDRGKVVTVAGQFLSTPSARRATISNPSEYGFSIISIHALREEGDSKTGNGLTSIIAFLSTPSARRATGPLTCAFDISSQFLSTPSARRATSGPTSGREKCRISIHALREEGDSKNGEKHLRFCFIIKRSAQIWKSLSKNIRKNSCDLHRTA